MAFGYAASDATGLKVFDMTNFNHPGGFAISTANRCNKIFCSWSTDSTHHAGQLDVTNDATLWAKLVAQSAGEIGSLSVMDCNGISPETTETSGIVLRLPRAGGWSKWDGDLDGKWSKIVSEGSIAVEGFSAEDLSALGTPHAATSQVVAGTNYKFAFADGTQITVLEQPWMPTPIQITQIEKPNDTKEVLPAHMPGGWTKFEGDLKGKWNEIVTKGSIVADGFSAEDLKSLGVPKSATSQVVAGTNYKFVFADGTEVTVLEQLWMPTAIQITNIENRNAVDYCPKSPEQFCRMLCPKPSCSGENQCAMRKGHCCEYDCVDPKDAKTVKADLASCTFEDGKTVRSGWTGPGRGDNYCNKCACTDGVFMCTLMACLPPTFLPPGQFSPPGALNPPQLTTWTLQGPYDIVNVQKYLDDFQEIFADTLHADKSVIQIASVAPKGSQVELTVSAFLNPMQAQFVKTSEFESMLRDNIESTADDLAKAMGYDVRAGNFILEGPWAITAVEANSFELKRQFAKALGVPEAFVKLEITEDDFLVKADFTAKTEGSKLAELDNPQLFQEKLQNQIKKTNPALATILGFGLQPVAPMTITECPSSEPHMPGRCAGSFRCEYGQECCCGKCHASMVYSCMNGEWLSYYTDACMVPMCELEGEAGMTELTEVEETIGNPGVLLSVDHAAGHGLSNTYPLIGVVLFGLVLGIAAAKGIESHCRKRNVNEDVYTDLHSDV